MLIANRNAPIPRSLSRSKFDISIFYIRLSLLTYVDCLNTPRIFAKLIDSYLLTYAT